jgi:DNA-binding MarR family transcriptional regulator
MAQTVPDPENRSRTADDAICEQVLIAIRRIIRAVDLHSRLLLGRYGLTGPQLVALKSLAESGEVPVGELARSVHLSQGTMTGILRRLEDRGLVTRRRGEVDRRQVLVQATPKTVDLLREAPSPLQERFLDELSKLADWEKSLTLSSLQRIVAMMEAESLDVAPVLATEPDVVVDQQIEDAISGPVKTRAKKDGH